MSNENYLGTTTGEPLTVSGVPIYGIREYLDAMAHLGPQRFKPHSIAKGDNE